MDVNPSIEGLEQYNETKSTSILQTNKLRAIRAVSDQMQKRLFSYMKKWMLETGHFDLVTKSNCVQRITKAYYNNISAAFQRWSNQRNKNDIQKNMAIIQQLGGTCNQYGNEARDNETDLRMKEDLWRTAKRTRMTKAFQTMNNRTLALGLGRWKDICNLKNSQEDRTLRVLMKLRKRFLRQAFDEYLTYLKLSRYHDRNLAGAKYLRTKYYHNLT